MAKFGEDDKSGFSNVFRFPSNRPQTDIAAEWTDEDELENFERVIEDYSDMNMSLNQRLYLEQSVVTYWRAAAFVFGALFIIRCLF